MGEGNLFQESALLSLPLDKVGNDKTCRDVTYQLLEATFGSGWHGEEVLLRAVASKMLSFESL